MNSLINVISLKKHFPVTKGLLRRPVGYIKAVDDVSFSLFSGETLGIVGESGCGKTTLARLLLRLIQPTSGRIEFQEKDVFSLKKKSLMNFRRKVQIVFQDPHSSLNPRLTVASTIGEALTIHKLVSTRRDRSKRIADLLNTVGLNPGHMYRYPHEFSGGQRQRIGIARALAVEPNIIVADEPVSSLDVSVQAQILNLLTQLQDKFQLTYIFIAHDLRVVEHISTRIIVMYLGKIVEIADKRDLYENPLHPYTKILLTAIPKLNPQERGFPSLLQGEPPTPLNPPSGCRFRTRCPMAIPKCSKEEPFLKEVTSNHFRACHII